MRSSGSTTTNGYLATLEKLLSYYPKKDYWSAYLGRLPRKPGFADRFALDLMRLKLANGLLTKTEDFMEMAQLCLQAGLPAEGRRVAEQGFKAGVLGTGPEANRHQRLRDLAIKQESEAKAALATQDCRGRSRFKEGDALVKVGYAYVSLGEVDKGIDLIQKGITKGHLKRPTTPSCAWAWPSCSRPRPRRPGADAARRQGHRRRGDIARLWAIVGTALNDAGPCAAR
jgi:hypothetical protein